MRGGGGRRAGLVGTEAGVAPSSAPARGSAPTLPRDFARDVRVRAVWLWAGLRVSLLAAGLIFGPVLGAGPVAFVGVVGLATFLVVADVRVTRESMLLANLGVSRGYIVSRSVPPIAAFEALWQLGYLLLVAA